MINNFSVIKLCIFIREKRERTLVHGGHIEIMVGRSIACRKMKFSLQLTIVAEHYPDRFEC